MIKYKATRYFRDEIRKVEVEKETEKMVVFPPRRGRVQRETKMSRDHCYFDTFDGAKNWVVNKATVQLENYKASVQRAEESLVRAKELTEVIK